MFSKVLMARMGARYSALQSSLVSATRQMMRFSGEHALCEQLVELARQPDFPKGGFGILVLDRGQQLVEQMDLYEAKCFLFW